MILKRKLPTFCQQHSYAVVRPPGSQDPSQIITDCLQSQLCLLKMYLINPFPSNNGQGGKKTVQGDLFCVQLKMPFPQMSSSINGTGGQARQRCCNRDHWVRKVKSLDGLYTVVASMLREVQVCVRPLGLSTYFTYFPSSVVKKYTEAREET